MNALRATSPMALSLSLISLASIGDAVDRPKIILQT
jgi:hypothetical protein